MPRILGSCERFFTGDARDYTIAHAIIARVENSPGSNWEQLVKFLRVVDREINVKRLKAE